MRFLDQNGALLISLVFTMLFLSIIAAGVVELRQTSTHTIIMSNNSAKTEFLAKGGKRLAQTFFEAGLPSNPWNGILTLANGDTIEISVSGTKAAIKGITGANTNFESIRRMDVDLHSVGAPAWVDTMEDTSNWVAGGTPLGSLDVVSDNTGNNVMQTSSEALSEQAGWYFPGSRLDWAAHISDLLVEEYTKKLNQCMQDCNRNCNTDCMQDCLAKCNKDCFSICDIDCNGRCDRNCNFWNALWCLPAEAACYTGCWAEEFVCTAICGAEIATCLGICSASNAWCLTQYTMCTGLEIACKGFCGVTYGIPIAALEVGGFSLESLSSILEAFGLINTGLTFPVDLYLPKTFTAFDWTQADGGNPIPFYSYWDSDVYDSISHDRYTLSYDLQVKMKVDPDQDYYMAGLSFRVNEAKESALIRNGGNFLGVSIIRGNNTIVDREGNIIEGIPDELVPVNRTGNETPLIVLWAQKDTNNDNYITPRWTWSSPLTGTTVELWPQERVWLAYAQMPTDFCVLDPLSNKYFLDWITLMVRVDEKKVSGVNVNDIKVFLSNADDAGCHGGCKDTPAGATDLMFDYYRGYNPRLPKNSRDAKWPVFNPAYFSCKQDRYSLLGEDTIGNKTEIKWTVNSAIPAHFGITVTKIGTGWENNAVLRIKNFTTDGYNKSANTPSALREKWPKEIGIHVFGKNDKAVYFDDYGIRLKGKDSF